MNFETLNQLIKTDFKKALPILNAKQKKDIADFKAEYKGNRELRTSQVGKRQNKTIGKGKDKKSVTVAKIPINYQKKIVRSAAAFLFGSPINITSDSTEALNIINKVWEDNRLDNTLKKMCEIVKSETEAVLFFNTEKGFDNNGKEIQLLKIRLKSSENGKYAPFFDEFGDMKAFTWSFESFNENNKKILNAWVFTNEATYKYAKSKDTWDLIETEKNLFTKIPVVYISQETPEWNIVEALIDQNEMTLSKFVDTNAYFASPIAVLYGTVNSLPDKEADGKAIKAPRKYIDGKLSEDGDVKYLTWDQAPEAIKLENDVTSNHIYALTDTPDLSFNNVKGINVTSGIALKLMFMGAIMKAKWSEGDYSTAISRIISLIQAGISNITSIADKGKFKDFSYKIKFTSILPDNLQEIITTLSEAVGGKPVMSQETAIGNNPLVQDSVQEMDNIKKESTASLGISAMP